MTLINKAFDLKNLLNYQKSAVVSREILKSEKGNVTLFAFDKNEGLSEHTAPFSALVLIIEGEANIKISGKSNLLKQGQMIIMPANSPHFVKAITPFKMLLIMIRGIDN